MHKNYTIKNSNNKNHFGENNQQNIHNHHLCYKKKAPLVKYCMHMDMFHYFQNKNHHNLDKEERREKIGLMYEENRNIL